MIFNIHTLDWDDELLEELNIPRCMLPEAKPSSCIYGMTDPKVFGAEVPIAGCIGDQQSALFGQTCFEEGSSKATYGTGAFLMMTTGTKIVESKNGLLTTIAWGINGEVIYCLEGNTFVAGAAVQWLRDELKLINSADETEALCLSVPDTNGVYLVPAFVGLAAPYWDPYARASILGITRGANRAHIVRATVESMCYQIKEILDAMVADCGIDLKEMKCDGGAIRNNFLLQFQSDMLNVPVARPVVTEADRPGNRLSGRPRGGVLVRHGRTARQVGAGQEVHTQHVRRSARQELQGLEESRAAFPEVDRRRISMTLPRRARQRPGGRFISSAIRRNKDRPGKEPGSSAF